jgi:hypothetical protein
MSSLTLVMVLPGSMTNYREASRAMLRNNSVTKIKNLIFRL